MKWGKMMEEKKEFEEQNEKKENKENKRKLTYSEYYSDMLVREQPFYRKGMSEEEKNREEEYLNNNMKDFYEGKYMPLWKQNWFK
ncbi:MAG: hypothetical protein IJ053_06705 [Lachnospiraceae bacterium]|nr:hypothetical protein [Lachnospiraceae bacterium]